MQLDFQRFEYKYVIPEALSQPIRDYIACYTHPDTFTRHSENSGYIIRSLYLDSPNLAFHRAKEQKALNRLKLRIRTYGTQGDGPIFFEIKRKIKGVIHKRRVQVHESSWAHHKPNSERLLVHKNSRNVDVMIEFMDLCQRYQVGPSMMVQYAREAYESEIDDYARVTFDRCLLGHFPRGYKLSLDERGWISLDDPTVMGIQRATVLELKFANQAPLWMYDLVQYFGLQRRGFSKYSTAVQYGLEAYFPPFDYRVTKPFL